MSPTTAIMSAFTLGGVETHQMAVDQPEVIAQVLLDSGLDVGTAFGIDSIDVNVKT